MPNHESTESRVESVFARSQWVSAIDRGDK